MSNSSVLSEKIEQIKQNAKKWEQEMYIIAEKAVREYVSDRNKEYNAYVNTRIEEIFNQAVTDFYSDYTPNGYRREGDKDAQNGGMYELLDIKTGEDGGVIAKEPYYDQLYDRYSFTGRNGAPLYNTVFRKGYHGGAVKISSSLARYWGAHPQPGIAYWRTAGYAIDPDTDEPFFHRFGVWGEPAKQSTPSPYIAIARQIKAADANGGEFDVAFDTFREKHLNILIQKIEDKSRELETKYFGG